MLFGARGVPVPVIADARDTGSSTELVSPFCVVSVLCTCVDRKQSTHGVTIKHKKKILFTVLIVLITYIMIM